MGQQTQEEPRLGLGNMRAPMTSARPLAGQTQTARTVRQPLAAPKPVRAVRQPISEPALVPQEEAAMDDVGETMLEEKTAPVEVEDVEPAVEEGLEADVETEASMTRPTALLKPIRGTLQPLVDEEEVRTAALTPVGHMLVPEKKKRGPPPSKDVGKGTTATLRPVRGKLTPVSKTPVKRLEPDEDEQDN